MGANGGWGSGVGSGAVERGKREAWFRGVRDAMRMSYEVGALSVAGN